jgi:hypothetical protein
VIKEKWGKGDSVPDTQIFKLDFTKSARYHKRKIKLVRRASGTAWQNGAPAIAESPPSLKKPSIVPDSQIFKIDFTKSSKYHKRKIKLIRRGSRAAESPTPLNTAAAEFMSHLNPKRAGTLKKLQLKKTPTFVIPAQNSGIAEVPEDTSSVEDRMDSEPPGESRSKKIKKAATYRITDRDGAAKAGEMATDHDQHFEAKEKNAAQIVRAQTTTLPTKPMSLMEEGLNYRELPRVATDEIELVGTVHGDGTVETKRSASRSRWFCCGRQALNIAEQQAIARTMTKKVDTEIDQTLILAMRDRVRRSHRNARFHRFVLFVSLLCSLSLHLYCLSACFSTCVSVYLSASLYSARGVTPGIVHHGGGPDMDELRDGEEADEVGITATTLLYAKIDQPPLLFLLLLLLSLFLYFMNVVILCTGGPYRRRLLHCPSLPVEEYVLPRATDALYGRVRLTKEQGVIDRARHGDVGGRQGNRARRSRNGNGIIYLLHNMSYIVFNLTPPQSLSTQAAEKRHRRADRKRKFKMKCRKATKCGKGRLPFWFKHVTMFLCLSYVVVMSLITIVYGIKFTLRGEELARQKGILQLSGLNITYFSNEITNASMMSFELNESNALDQAFVTLDELATRRNITDVDAYDFDLYANDTVRIVRPVAEEEDEIYTVFGQEGTDPIDLTDPTDLTDPPDPTYSTDPTDDTDPTDPTPILPL